MRITDTKSEQKVEIERKGRKNDLIYVPEFGYNGKTTNTSTCMIQDIPLCIFWLMLPDTEILKFWPLSASAVTRTSTLYRRQFIGQQKGQIA